MFIDKGNLDKVVYNLLSNAFKYTPSGGTILFSVNVDEVKKCLYIQVADTGVGIPKEKAGRNCLNVLCKVVSPEIAFGVGVAF